MATNVEGNVTVTFTYDEYLHLQNIVKLSYERIIRMPVTVSNGSTLKQVTEAHEDLMIKLK